MSLLETSSCSCSCYSYVSIVTHATFPLSCVMAEFREQACVSWGGVSSLFEEFRVLCSLHARVCSVLLHKDILFCLLFLAADWLCDWQKRFQNPRNQVIT